VFAEQDGAAAVLEVVVAVAEDEAVHAEERPRLRKAQRPTDAVEIHRRRRRTVRRISSRTMRRITL
jgi:hypothetical protein